MSKNNLPSPLDTALAHVDPDRRKFLGMLLAGAAALPLLASADLSAEEKPGSQKAQAFPKNAAKSNSTIKSNQAATDKSSNLKAQTWTKGGAPLKSNQALKNSSGTIKSNAAIKQSNSTIKSSSTNKTIK
ncbi:MAG: hypothetical protein ABR906_06335 [Terracidiphilus sp.]|jgi:hypothetical protein